MDDEEEEEGEEGEGNRGARDWDWTAQPQGDECVLGSRETMRDAGRRGGGEDGSGRARRIGMDGVMRLDAEAAAAATEVEDEEAVAEDDTAVGLDASDALLFRRLRGFGAGVWNSVGENGDSSDRCSGDLDRSRAEEGDSSSMAAAPWWSGCWREEEDETRDCDDDAEDAGDGGCSRCSCCLMLASAAAAARLLCRFLRGDGGGGGGGGGAAAAAASASVVPRISSLFDGLLGKGSLAEDDGAGA